MGGTPITRSYITTMPTELEEVMINPNPYKNLS